MNTQPSSDFSLPPELEAALKRRSETERRQLATLWHRLGTLEPPLEGVPNNEQAWNALSHRLHPNTRTASLPRQRTRLRWPLIAMLFIGLGLLGMFWLNQPRSVTVPLGIIQTVTFDDGSTVFLRGGSKLIYPRSPFSPRPRWLRLEGEALFAVAPGPLLTISTPWAHVEVLGTRLSVRAWPEASETQVTLLEGRIRVRATTQPEHALLLTTPGQHVRLSARQPFPATPERVDPEYVLAWQRGGFVVIDEPVTTVLRELERSFGLRIEVTGSLPLTRRLTVLYQHDAQEERILQDLCLMLSCHYRRISRGFVLEPDSAAMP
jgi:transmembrane sensor